MCWSPSVSFITWSVVLVAAGGLLLQPSSPDDKWVAIFALCFTLIQLLEGGIWTSIDSRATAWIAGLTAVVLVALWSQPLVQTYLGWRTTGSAWLKYGTVVFLATFVYAIYRALTETFTTTVGPNGHLVWVSRDNRSFLSGGVPVLTVAYLAGLLVPLLFMKSTRLKYALLTYGLATLGYSMWNYTKTEEMSTMWCWLACGYVLIPYLVR